MREEEPLNENQQPAQSAGDQTSPAGDAEQNETSPQDQAGGDKPGTLRVFEEDVVEALKHVYDPEIPINVYELGLIYNVYVNDNNDVKVEMTLTTPNCPEAQNIPPKTKGMIKKMVPGVNEVNVELVWEPAWTTDMMSEDAKLALGLF
jgi:FeS assembly SUF system protein